MKLDSIFKKQSSPSMRGIDMSQYGVGGLNSGEENSESGNVTPNTSSFKGNSGSIKEQIAAKESRGEKNPYRAFNPDGGGEGAVGKYQFRWKKWKSDIEKVTGIKTIEDFKNNPQAQEDYMDYHLKNHNYPFIQEVKNYDKNGLSESDIIKLIHFRGLPDAKKYVQGDLNQKRESYNMTGNEYLGRPKHALGAVLPLVQTGISLVTSVIDAERKRKEMNKVNSLRLNEQQQIIQNNSEATLNQYPVYGDFRGGFYAQGGNIPQYEVESGEVVQGDAQLQSSKKIASDLHHVTGATHEEGGVVGQGGERVFSNRLSIPVELLALLRKSKIKADPLSTYADVAVNLGKMKGKFESKLGSYKPRTVNTGKLMLERVDGLLDMVFNTQEQSKLPVFAKGGVLPKYAYGQPIKPRNLSGLRKYSMSPFFEDKPTNEIVTLPPYKNRFPNSNSPLTGLEPTINDSNPNKLPQAEVTASKLPRKPLSFKLNATGFQTQNLGDRIKPISAPQQEGVPETGDLQYKPDNANLWLTALGAVGNTLINSKFDTSVKRNLMQNPGYTYNDRSGLSQWQAQQAYRTGLKSLDLSTSQGTQNNATNMMWKTQNVLSQIHNQENQRRDQYNSQYTDSTWRTQAANTGIVNQANDMRRDLKNDKLAGYQNILNNTIGNVNTILSERDARRLEADKLNWIGKKGNLGGRNITDFQQEELDRILGLSSKKKK